MQSFDIESLIPQRPPFVLVDKLLSCDRDKTTSTFVVRPDHVLCENDQLLEAGLIENIAQTAAARMGYLSKAEGQPVKTGYIGSIKNLVVHFRPAANKQLSTEVEMAGEYMGFNLIKGSVYVDGQLAAACEMRIFLLEQQDK